MYFPPLEPVSNTESYISGDVTIDPSAIVAPGAILQAAPGSKIVIGAGVCIGMGAIIKAYQGKIEVQRGAILGAAVLVVGNSQIGYQSSIGAATTIFNSSVNAMAVIAPGSVIGDSSRQIAGQGEQSVTDTQPRVTQQPSDESQTPIREEQPSEAVQNLVQKPVEEARKPPPEDTPTPIEESVTESAPVESQPQAPETPEVSFEESPWDTESETETEIELETEVETQTQFPLPSTPAPVIGKVYINQLLLTLFPHNQTSSKSPSLDNK